MKHNPPFSWNASGEDFIACVIQHIVQKLVWL
jgi:hypothetical protein